MISEFEQRLADVLGTRLSAPFTGRVEVAPGPDPGADPIIFVGTRRAEPVEPDIGSQRPEVAPGSEDHRRVLRLRCTVDVEFHAGSDQGRQQQMAGLDAALYALGAPDFRDGSALVDGDDPGFLINELRVIDCITPLDPSAEDAPHVGLTLSTEGWFWPVGLAGEAGTQIGEIRVRGAILPLMIEPSSPDLVVGGPQVELTAHFRTIGSLTLREDHIEPLPIEALAFALSGPGGRPGAGTLAGGAAGTDGVRLVELHRGAATIAYAPPDQATTEELVVAMDDGGGGLGLQIGRFPLKTQEA